MRKVAVIVWLMGIFLAIAGLFWYNEWVYALPTPVPAHYVEVPPGSRVRLPGELSFREKEDSSFPKPLFLHFFNPDCPCSRFNIPQFKALVAEYGSQVDFAIVLMSSKHYTEGQIDKKFGLSLPVFTDSSIAVACGVYSTPQAALLTGDRRLFYRGNYNRSRYCADPSTNFAGQALEALLKGHPKIVFGPPALRAYGCSLPNCNK